MTDHIIKAAREAGFVVQRDEWVLQTMLRTFYDIAFAAGMERAAEICEGIADDYEKREGRKYPEMKSDAQTGASDCEYAIRAEAHAQNQPKNVHDTGNVSKN